MSKATIIINTVTARARSHLKVAALVQRVGRPKDRHLPFEQVILVAQLHAESLDGLLLETLVLER